MGGGCQVSAALKRTRFKSCERVIEKGLATFFEVGEAMKEMRDDQLYKQAGYKSFEKYLQERWGMTRTHGDRLIGAAGVLLGCSSSGRKARPRAGCALRSSK